MAVVRAGRRGRAAAERPFGELSPDRPDDGFASLLAALARQAEALKLSQLICRYSSGEGAFAVVREWHTLAPAPAALFAQRAFRQAWPIERAAADSVLPFRWSVQAWPGEQGPIAYDAMAQLADAGLEAGVSLAVRGPYTRMTIVTAFCEPAVAAALGEEDLDRWLAAASRFHARIAAADGTAQPRSVLSRREFEILRLTAEGLTAAAAARSLALSEATVKFHLSSVRRKLKVKNTAEAVARLNLSAASGSD